MISHNFTQEARRYRRFRILRGEGKKLGEINQILAQEGFSEVSGPGVQSFPNEQLILMLRKNKLFEEEIIPQPYSCLPNLQPVEE